MCKIDISESGDRVAHEDSHVKSDKYEEIKKILQQIAQDTLPSAILPLTEQRITYQAGASASVHTPVRCRVAQF